MEEKSIITYKPAAETIKAAILQGQYEAAKGVNRVQLAVYFGIGKYISLNTRYCVWGAGALKAISQILRKELPGLRGYSETSLKNMRKFYENWMMLDPNPSVVTDELANLTLDNKETPSSKSAIMIADLQSKENQVFTNSAIVIAELKDYHIDIYQALKQQVTCLMS